MADKLNVGTVGSEVKPVYIKNGIPVAIDGLATEEYVNNIVAGGDSSDKLSKNGDTMLGVLTLQDNLILTRNVHYGPELPEEGVEGQIFFLEDDGISLPLGGTAGQILLKRSDRDNDADWVNPEFLPLSGGQMTGLILRESDINNYWSGRDSSIIYKVSNSNSYSPILSAGSRNGSFDIGTEEGNLKFSFVPNESYSQQTDEGIVSKIYMTPEGHIGGEKVYGAVYNDYAEFRQFAEDKEIPYGRVVIENGDDTLSLSTERMQSGGNVCSDTFGFAIGKTSLSTMPIAVSGRVLVYPYEDRNTYCPGDAVCSAPNGTISKMTREEIKEYPDRIIGYVSAVPQYETWGENNILVNNRIWIKVV